MKMLKFKLGIIISTILLIIFVGVLLYYNSVLNKLAVNSSVQILSNLGLEHESELLNEIENTKAKSDILALIFSKNIKNNEFNANIYKLLSSVLENSPNIYSFTIAYNKHMAVSDSLVNIEQKINQRMNYLNVERGKKGISINTKPLAEDLKLKLLKKELATEVQKRIFEPVQNNEGNFYIPILTPIFSGQKYLGYIQANISLAWFNEIITLDNRLKNMQIYLVSGSDEIVSTNSKKFILGDKISSICTTCLSASSKTYTNYTIASSNLTYCHPLFWANKDGVWRICYKANKNQLFDMVGYQFWNYFLVGLLLLIISIALVFIFIDYILNPFKMLIGFAEKIALGDFKWKQDNIETIREDEFGQLQKAFREISDALEETAEVSNAIASGDFSKTVKVKSEQDFLASSINQMNNYLKQKEEKEQSRVSDEEKQKWLNNGIALISDVLKKNQDNTNILADKIIKTLVEFLNISLAGIYIKELTDDQKVIYRLIAAYAYSEQKFIDKKFHTGESLVGSCASEKRTIYMSSIPENYMKIFSGLGESVPQSLLLIPIVYNDEVFGVLELASLKEISKFKQEFLQQAADNIASTLSLTQISSQTADLLEKSRLQAAELKKRDREMINTLNELKELQQETAKRETEVRSKITAMNNSLMIVEYTTEGIVLDANQKFLNAMNFTLEEIKGVNVIELLQEKEKKELTDIINTVKKGNYYETAVKRHTKYGKEKWLLASYTPVLDELGVTSSILFFATDISRIAAKERRLQDRINQLENDSEQIPTD